ncbi:MAG: hypothetical protein WCP19_02540 [Chloroflexota bacterium]
MNVNHFQFINPIDTVDYEERLNGLASAAWPEFMLHDPISAQYWNYLFTDFPKFQFAIIDTKKNTAAAMANSVPIHWAGNLEDLPEEGWDWAFQKSVSDHKEGKKPNMLCAIQVAIHPNYRHKSISREMVKEMRKTAITADLHQLIAPVRPSQKSLYPIISIDHYINWINDENLPFDGWLRVHARMGAKIIKPCHRAMQITGSISEWEKWSGLKFPESSDYVIPGALVPVQIDIENNLGIYIEPNVWMVHEIS